ncbi:protein PFC0760c-like [Oppia nitens]|uniref:protein PFC0760c-like n=1 Tax=Oppia nitens TaxID=1686743 RepID=UPI0023D9BA54|nr:protein PFC0760c-like [Oppia nitens]
MSTNKRIIVSLMTMRPPLDDYWFAIPSMVKTISDLKRELTADMDALNGVEVDLFMDNVLLRDNSLIDMIEDKDRVEIKTKTSCFITTLSTTTKRIKREPIDEKLITTNSISIGNKMVNNLMTKCVKQEINSDEEEMPIDTKVRPMVDIKVEKQSIVNNNNEEEVIDISDESSCDDSSDDESNDEHNNCIDRDVNNDDKDKVEIKSKFTYDITTDINNSEVKKKRSKSQSMAKDITVTDSDCVGKVDTKRVKQESIDTIIKSLDINSMKKRIKELIATNSISNENKKIVNNLMSKWEPINDEKDMTEVRPLVNIKVEKQRIDTSDESSSDSSDDESIDDNHNTTDKAMNDNYYNTVIKQELPIESIVKIHDNNNNNTVNGFTSLQTNVFMATTYEKQFLLTTTENNSKRQHKTMSSYYCYYNDCNKLYNTEHQLAQHMKAKHQINLFPFRCPQKRCQSVFKLKEQLEEHKQTKHSNTGAVIGSIDSNIKSMTASDITYLRFKQSLVKKPKVRVKFTCDYNGCNRQYRKKNKFIFHRRLHNICAYDDCLKIDPFINSYYLIKHLKDVHNIVWLPAMLNLKK